MMNIIIVLRTEEQRTVSVISTEENFNEEHYLCTENRGTKNIIGN